MHIVLKMMHIRPVNIITKYFFVNPITHTKESPDSSSVSSSSEPTGTPVRKEFTYGEYEQKLQSFAFMLNPDRKIRRKTEISSTHSSEMITASIKSGEITLKSSVPESFTVKELIHKVKRKLPIGNTTFFQMFLGLNNTQIFNP